MFRFSREARESVEGYIKKVREKVKNSTTEVDPADLDEFLSEVEDDLKYLALQLSKGREATAVDKRDVNRASRKIALHLFRVRRTFSRHHNATFKDLQFLIDTLESAETPRILDAGCGWGRISRRVSRHLDGNCDVVGIDIDTSPMKYGRLTAAHMSFVRSDVRHLPFRDNVFRLILCHEAMHEIADENDRSEVLNGFTRVMNNSAVYFSDLYVRSSVGAWIQSLLHTLTSSAEKHLRITAFEEELAKHGFRIIMSRQITRPLSLNVIGSHIVVKDTGRQGNHVHTGIDEHNG